MSEVVGPLAVLGIVAGYHNRCSSNEIDIS